MKYILALIACLVCFAGSSPAQSVFLIDSAASSCGTSTVNGVKGASEATAFSIGGLTPTSATGTGKPTLSDLIVQKYVGQCSSSYLTEFLTGQTIPTLVLIETKASTNGTAATVLMITLENAGIDSYNLSLSTTGSLAVEQISFKYSGIKIVAYPLDANGNPGANPTTLSYDLASNTVR